jgi:tRNA-specific 2-thiouridylase
VLGRHEGIIHYTIGQRRGLGIAGGEPLYVVRIDAPARRVVVGPREALRKTEIRVSGLNWLGERPLEEAPQSVYAKIRSARPPVPAEIRLEQGAPTVTIRGGEHGVSPGQACVLYEGEGAGMRVLGGGFIARA